MYTNSYYCKISLNAGIGRQYFLKLSWVNLVSVQVALQVHDKINIYLIRVVRFYPSLLFQNKIGIVSNLTEYLLRKQGS